MSKICLCVKILGKQAEQVYFCIMIAFIKKYKAFLIGLVITRVITLILIAEGVILIDNDEILSNVLGFLFYWMLISVFIHQIPYLKKKKKTVFMLVGLIAFLIVIIVIDANNQIPDNPIILILLVVFHLSCTYVIVPKFFLKYKWFISGAYAFALSVFLYLRLFAGSFEYYSQQKKEILLLFIIPIPIFIGLWIYEQWRWVKTLQAEKSKTELSLLKSQINPHFLFNTLNNLYGLAVEKSDEAPGVILKLSDMLRYTIYEGKEDRVFLKDEIAYLANYIELHKIRYHKKVDISFDYEGFEDQKIAPLLFIILLENAFKHGVEIMTEDAYIHMSIRSNGDKIVFKIENNFEPDSKKTTKGIGLDNLKERLRLIYPHKHELVLEENDTSYKAVLELTTS